MARKSVRGNNQDCMHGRTIWVATTQHRQHPVHFQSCEGEGGGRGRHRQTDRQKQTSTRRGSLQHSQQANGKPLPRTNREVRPGPAAPPRPFSLPALPALADGQRPRCLRQLMKDLHRTMDACSRARYTRGAWLRAK